MSLKKKSSQFIYQVQAFDYKLNEFGDPYWEILFPDAKNNWHHFHISSYQKTFYISHSNGETGSIELIPDESFNMEENDVFGKKKLKRKWLKLIKAATKWLEQVKNDWIAANLRVQNEYPLKYRFGIIPYSLILATLPKVSAIKEKLGAAKSKTFVQLVEAGFFKRFDKPELSTMTAKQYFDYCKIAYLATEEDIDLKLSGRALYQRFADGRHEGLLDIEPDSEQTFSDWLDGKHPKRGGGHPWEIIRGGSYTHIGMRVQRPYAHRKEGYTIELYGQSIRGLSDTIKMFLAIHEQNLPIHIVEPEKIRKQLLGQEKVGIVPDYELISFGDRHFEMEENVFERVYFGDLEGFEEVLLPFVKWENLPVLRLRKF